MKQKAQRDPHAIRRIKIAGWVSTASSILILIIKFAAYNLTHSSAILSDALESIVNVTASIVALIIIRYMVEPADEEHPYGHGKLEFFSSAFEGGLIGFAALSIIYEAIQGFVKGSAIHQLDLGILVVVASGILNLFLALYLRHEGKKFNSETLQASGAHIMSDVWTTVGLFVGLGLIRLTGLIWLDSAIALLFGIQLCFSGYKIVRKSIAGLIDELDPKTLENLAKAIEKNRRPGVIDLHAVRMIRAGGFHHIEAHLVVPEYWNIAKVHDSSEEFAADIVLDYPYDGEVIFHFDPCYQSYCDVCDLLDCPIRKNEFKGLKNITLRELVKGPEPTHPVQK
jgi:cation diffusion facilitator family transporter